MILKRFFGILGFLIFYKNVPCASEEEYTFVNKVRFPFSQFYDPFMGLIIAFDLKLVPSEIDADFGWNMEANYFLPQNESEYTFPPIIPSESTERGFFERSMLYRMVELKLEPFSKTYGGNNCFLKIICELSCHTTKDTDVLGDIFHILLSPSSSVNKDLPSKYTNAEAYGRRNHHCKKYYKNCPVDLVAVFSVLGDLLDSQYI